MVPSSDTAAQRVSLIVAVITKSSAVMMTRARCSRGVVTFCIRLLVDRHRDILPIYCTIYFATFHHVPPSSASIPFSPFTAPPPSGPFDIPGVEVPADSCPDSLGASGVSFWVVPPTAKPGLALMNLENCLRS